MLDCSLSHIAICNIIDYKSTKSTIEAYNNRGSDYRTSHDIEDVIYILDNRTTIVDEIAQDDLRIANFIQEQLLEIRKKGLLQEVLISHIHPLMLAERMSLVEEKISEILDTNYNI